MDSLTETRRHASLIRPPASEFRDACLVKIYPPGAGMGARFVLSNKPVVVGRGKDCDIQVNDHSVSRSHARIELTPLGYRASDLKSTNGTFINDSPGTCSA